MTHAMLTCCPASTSTPPRGSATARLRTSSGGPAGALPTAIPGSRMTLGNDTFVVSVWQRLGHHFPADVAPPPCKCRAGVAAEADHAMVCEKVAKMTQMRHDNLDNALRLVVSACSCHSAAEPRYRALAGKKGMANASARATSWRCCRGLSLRQWMLWLRTRLRSRTLLRLPRHLGGLRRGLNGPSGRGSGRIMLHSGLCRFRLRRAGTWVRRR